MRKGAARRDAFSLSAASVARFLIASYFFGLGIGVIDGTDVSALLRPFLPDGLAVLFSSALLMGLALLLLVGRLRRVAALLLALAIFWASYLTLVVQAGQDQLGAFWRDLALIGALLLTFRETADSIEISPLSLLTAGFRRVRARTGDAENGLEVTLPDPAEASEYTPPRHPRRVRTEIYRQDFEEVRAS